MKPEQGKIQLVEDVCHTRSRVFVRNPYNYDAHAVSIATGLSCPEPGKAVQSQRDESDINTIVRRFGIDGKMPVNVRMPEYGDFSGIGSYHEAQNALKMAETSFMALPAKIRNRFNNDPAELIEFCNNPANLDEARTFGLVPEKELPTEGAVPATGAGSQPVKPPTPAK